MIRATVSCDNDDYGPVIEFDATAWFEQASNDDIRGLREEGYGCSYASDCVAEFMADRNPVVSGFFSYLSFRQDNCRGSGCGYTVRVNADDAEAWIAEHRPHLAAKVDA